MVSIIQEADPENLELRRYIRRCVWHTVRLVFLLLLLFFTRLHDRHEYANLFRILSTTLVQMFICRCLKLTRVSKLHGFIGTVWTFDLGSHVLHVPVNKLYTLADRFIRNTCTKHLYTFVQFSNQPIRWQEHSEWNHVDTDTAFSFEEKMWLGPWTGFPWFYRSVIYKWSLGTFLGTILRKTGFQN